MGLVKRNRKYSLISIGVVIAWLILAGIGGPYFGRISEVSSNDLSAYLPKSAESTRLNDELAGFRTKKTISAIIVFESTEELNPDQLKQIENARKAMAETGEIKGKVSEAVISEDKKASFVVAPLDSNSKFSESIATLRNAVEANVKDLDFKFTGPAMFARDLNKAFAGIDGTLLIVALSVVFVILLFIYRSPILPVITLAGALLALAVSILLVWQLANADIVQMNGQVQGILFILVIGATTDYALLYIARYREELTISANKWDATLATLKASWEPIVAAGGTVTLGLMCLLFSELGSNRALGPVGGIGIIFAIISALTFIPATLALFGRKAFWPKPPKLAVSNKLSYREAHPFWSKIAKFVGRHPRRIWISIVIMLAIASAFVPQLQADGVDQSNLVIGASEARDGQKMLDRHFASGSGSPVLITLPKDQLNQVVEKLDKFDSISSISVSTDSAKTPSMPIGNSRSKIDNQIEKTIIAKRDQQVEGIRQSINQQLIGAPDYMVEEVIDQALTNIPSIDELKAQADPFRGVEPKVVDGRVLLQATLKHPASSVEARQDVDQLRTSIQAVYPEVRFGGVSAVQLDTNKASEKDLMVLIPMILVAITIVLMVLLRSIIAPLVLLVTTVLSFGATIGISALLFNNLWHYTGADPAILIFGFVFLVALGIDYNIFLMTRVREETGKLGVREGTLKALIVTGGVITSAGIVLASTFAALYVIPILFLAQIAFIVAFGVILDTVIVRSLLVPSLVLEIGQKVWWPSKLSSKKLKK